MVVPFFFHGDSGHSAGGIRIGSWGAVASPSPSPPAPLSLSQTSRCCSGRPLLPPWCSPGEARTAGAERSRRMPMMHNEQMVGRCGVPTAAAPWQCGVLSSIRATFPANSPSLSLGSVSLLGCHCHRRASQLPRDPDSSSSPPFLCDKREYMRS